MEMSKDKLTNIKKWYLEHGLIPRKKKSGGQQERTALTMDDIRNVTRFILNYAELHSIVLPGRVPGFSRTDIKILPSHESRASLWRQYKLAAETDPQTRVVGYDSFRNLWKRLVPYVVIGNPASDLCWICQKNNNLIIKAINLPEKHKQGKN